MAALFRAALLSTMHVKHEMHMEHMMAGITIDSAMILNTSSPFLPVGSC